jgi:hypothetical protein
MKQHSLTFVAAVVVALLGIQRAHAQVGLGSYNWAGYAVDSFSTKQLYTAAEISWIVPKITSGQTISPYPNDTQTTGIWVGIGGNCTNLASNAYCFSYDNTLIQLGIQSFAPSKGKPTYSTFWLALYLSGATPPPGQQQAQGGTPLPKKGVHPGDQIHAGLSCVANCTAGALQTWMMYMDNLTTKEQWQNPDPIYFASNFTSAEWILETADGDPNCSSDGRYPLANFGTATISAASANGQVPNLNPPWFLSIVPSLCGGQKALLSLPRQTNSSATFNVCYVAPGSQVTKCNSP